MKILSDFDGVMTEQTEEAQFQRAVFSGRLGMLTGLGNKAAHWVARAADETTRHAHVHGWWSHGRLAAFADEDHFVHHHAIASCLDAWAEGGEASLVEARAELAADGMLSFVQVMGWAYHELVKHTHAGNIKPMDPAVGEVIAALLGDGAEVIVVSNSPSDRILALLRAVGLDAVAHDHDPLAKLRVRGAAGKFHLGARAQAFEVDGRAFDADRPSYRAILEEEVPDVVIGDVFSLDLSLPLYLSDQPGAGLEGVDLLLRTRDYTPQWARQICVDGRWERKARLGTMTEFAQLRAVCARRLG